MVNNCSIPPALTSLQQACEAMLASSQRILSSLEEAKQISQVLDSEIILRVRRVCEKQDNDLKQYLFELEQWGHVPLPPSQMFQLSSLQKTILSTLTIQQRVRCYLDYFKRQLINQRVDKMELNNAFNARDDASNRCYNVW